MARESVRIKLVQANRRAGSPKNVRRSQSNCLDEFTVIPFLLIELGVVPRPDPGPAWTAEECADCGQGNCLHQKPSHDPERERFGAEPCAKSLAYPIGVSRGNHHKDGD